MGGDELYEVWIVPCPEPVISDRIFENRCPENYKNVSYEERLCLASKSLQKKIKKLKTNCRDFKLLEKS